MVLSVLGNFYQQLLLLLPYASDSFNYDDPSRWYLDYPQCAGYRQSPIAINTLKAVPVDLPPIFFGLYDVFFEDYVHMHNDGHTVKFDVIETTEGRQPFITGSVLNGVYEAQEVHFHWGSPQRKGSEHKLNGRRYDMEMHIVHKNTKYESTDTARNFEDGFAVIAVLFKAVKSPNVFYPGLNTVYNSLNRVVDYNSTATTAKLISLGSMLGDIDRGDFFTYAGSLTTPPCSEAVTWIVFSDVIPISNIQLAKFWKLRDERGKLLRNNFRPLQYIDNRKIYHRRPVARYEF